MSEGSTIDQDEIAKFGALAGTWWDPEGGMRPLHRLNPARLAFIREQTCLHFGRDPASDRPLEGLEVLDLGCGGGLLSEPLARLGAEVRGVDASQKAVDVARWHAGECGLAIDYACATAEELAGLRERREQIYDAVRRLPEPYRRTVALRYFAGMSTAEVASGEGVEEGTVRCRLHVAADGAVTRVDVVESSGHRRLDRAAVAALLLWRFEPASASEAPWTLLHPVTFLLEDPS